MRFMIDILLLLILLAIVAYWWDTMRVNDLAMQYSLSTCERFQVQLLDGSVQRQRVWLRLSEAKHMQLCRMYNFEFSADGATRYSGVLVLLGHTLGEIELEPHRMPE